uniref:Odorant receptor n=1 Tax=Plutella xylostella TaxID=51655 RepID=A0A2K5B184_PLUXY|nr:olfactory receptor 8 [Plutella xylostella]
MEIKSACSGGALRLGYIRIVRRFLWFPGSWPGRALGERVPPLIRYHQYQIQVQTLLILVGQILYLAEYHETMSFLTIGHVYITTFLAFLTSVRVLVPLLPGYKKVVKTFLMEFHLFYHQHKGTYEKQIAMYWDKYSYVLTLFQMAMVVLGMTLFNLLPVYKSYRAGAFTAWDLTNKTLEYSIYYTLPGFNCLDHFYIATTLNLYLSYITSCSICTLDLLLILIVFQIIGHIQILKYNIENIPTPSRSVSIFVTEFSLSSTSNVTVQLYNKEENYVIKQKLIGFISHHRFIISFADRVSSLFGAMLAFNYLFQLVSGCVLLLECSSMDPDALARFGPLTCIVFGELIQISIIFEYIGYISEKLIDAVYCMPWESMDVSNQKTVKFFLSRIQTPIQLTAMGIVPVGVQTMLGILKTTLSYFALLKSISE